MGGRSFTEALQLFSGHGKVSSRLDKHVELNVPSVMATFLSLTQESLAEVLAGLQV